MTLFVFLVISTIQTIFSIFKYNLIFIKDDYVNRVTIANYDYPELRIAHSMTTIMKIKNNTLNTMI